MKIQFFILILFCSCKSITVVEESSNLETKVEYHENGIIKTVGKIDWDYLSDEARIGLWNEFYENGKLKESGEYQPDFYTNCCTGGPCSMAYSYKIGEWSYFYNNGQLKAHGKYQIGKKHIDTSCEGGDDIKFSFINGDWKFYAYDGNEMSLSKDEIKKIQEHGLIDGFDLIKNKNYLQQRL